MPEKKSSQAETNPMVDAETGVQNEQLQPHMIATQAETFFEGPLPPPDTLAQYEKILPGIADRIVKMAESEQQARHAAISQDAQNKAALVNIAAQESAGALSAQKLGQLIGLGISVFCVLCAFVCVLLNESSVVICAFVAVPTASLIGSFMPKLWTKDEHNEKNGN